MESVTAYKDSKGMLHGTIGAAQKADQIYRIRTARETVDLIRTNLGLWFWIKSNKDLVLDILEV